MDGSPSSIIMLGLGNGTFNGSPSLVVTLGFGVGTPVVPVVGPYYIDGAQFYVPGSVTGQIYTAGSVTGQVK